MDEQRCDNDNIKKMKIKAGEKVPRIFRFSTKPGGVWGGRCGDPNSASTQAAFFFSNFIFFFLTHHFGGNAAFLFIKVLKTSRATSTLMLLLGSHQEPWKKPGEEMSHLDTQWILKKTQKTQKISTPTCE